METLTRALPKINVVFNMRADSLELVHDPIQPPIVLCFPLSLPRL
jgi:hypothetical protein